MYYLNSRYYDSNTGRFISPDSFDVLTVTPDQLTDKNLYAYCDNNPITRIDGDGEFWFFIGALIGAAIGFIGTVVADYVDDGEVFNGSISTEGYIANTLVGGLTGGIGSSTFNLTLPTFNLATTSMGSVVLVGGTTTVTIGGTSILAGIGVLGSVLTFARIGKSGGYRIDHHYPNDHDPTHVHISGDDGKTRVNLQGNPIQGDRPMTPGERKAFFNLFDEIIKVLKPWS